MGHHNGHARPMGPRWQEPPALVGDRHQNWELDLPSGVLLPSGCNKIYYRSRDKGQEVCVCVCVYSKMSVKMEALFYLLHREHYLMWFIILLQTNCSHWRLLPCHVLPEHVQSLAFVSNWRTTFYLLLAAKKGQDQVGVVIFTVQTLQWLWDWMNLFLWKVEIRWKDQE